MAQRIVRQNWRSRDMPRALALLIWVGFAAMLLLLPFDWSPVRRAFTFRPKVQEAVIAPIVNNDEIYTGSIVFVPPIGDNCWKRMLDNRTGTMWDLGYIDCYVAVPPDNGRHPTMSGERMMAIGKALRSGGN